MSKGLKYISPLFCVERGTMRVLVACEFSGIVRESFRRRGHDAWSCDLLESEIPGQHMQCGVRRALQEWPWDLMIAHPPCTHLAVSGARWFKEKQAEQTQALEFVRMLMEAAIARIAIENPVSIISSRIRKPDQVIQPWMFGHGETKTTCLWLKGLPKLEPTDLVVPEWAVRSDGTIHMSKKGKRDNPTHFLTGRTTRVLSGPQLQQWNRIHHMPPSPERWRNRSRTYGGIAEAMAEQWGTL
jgi:site-specific DNA-cytosine methylase